MTETVIRHSTEPNSAAAGTSIGNGIAQALSGPPDALIVFASAQHDYGELLRAIQAACAPRLMVGCSSAGEFVSRAGGEGTVSAIALKSGQMRFAAGIGRGLRADRAGAAAQMAASFKGLQSPEYIYRYAMVLTDALAGHADDLIEQLNLHTGGTYHLFGGGAGDDARFQRTHVFCGTEVVPDAAVALEILSNKPLGIGVQHGWQPASPPLRVTEADGLRLISLNAAPAVESFQEHATATNQAFDPANPTGFFLHNVLGIDTGHGYKLRVPLALNSDGSIDCAANVPAGALVHIMTAVGATPAEAVTQATQSAVEQLQGQTPQVALFFDCVATRLRLGHAFNVELEALQRALGPAQYAGCNTYGQIARVEGQFSGFHNCTAVVCVIPE